MESSEGTRHSSPAIFAINAPPPSSHRTVVQLSRRGLAVLTALLLLPWLIAGAILLRSLRAGVEAGSTGANTPTVYDDYVFKCRPGPWGELQYSRLVIEPPDEFTDADYSQGAPPRWEFVGYTPDMLRELWEAAALNQGQIRALQQHSSLEVTPTSLVLHPSEELVFGLSPSARATIYSALSAFPENPNQHEPFRFRADTAAEWFQHSNLAPETIHLVERLLYRRGTSLLFSDHNLVLPRIPTNPERVRLVKILARRSTLLVKLRVRPDSDIAELADYWGRGPRRKGMRALLDSIAKRPDGITIDVAHLLPRFPRAHLFTYPQVPEETEGHDCHWSSLNFFNDPADPRFTDTAVVKQALEQDYAAVTGRPQLGDVFVFIRADGSVIHSCVYIADDIVFTKNGASEVMPWILMNLSDVIAFYPADPPLTIRAYRRKDV